LHAHIQGLEAQLRESDQDRARAMEEMKRALLRGVCALNLEAMGAMRTPENVDPVTHLPMRVSSRLDSLPPKTNVQSAHAAELPSPTQSNTDAYGATAISTTRTQMSWPAVVPVSHFPRPSSVARSATPKHPGSLHMRSNVDADHVVPTISTSTANKKPRPGRS
jgi:hypothetical protein